VKLHFGSEIFDYQLLRATAYTTYGGAEIGECLVTAERITDGDTESWHEEWLATAERVERTADDALAAGNERTARGAYFRAHNYYRTAEFFLEAEDARRIPTYERSVEAFRSGASLLPRPPERLSFPYEDTELPGYLFLPGDGDEVPEVDGPLPTVVCLGGFDSIQEELYFLCGVPEALARGYAVVHFEGPGQGAPLRYEELTARTDWENVVGPVLDGLESRDEVDEGRLALVGVSFGGYYAPRAAVFDDRIAACVAFDHMHDLWRASAGDNPRMAAAIAHVPDRVVNALASAGERFSVQSRWLMENSRWVFDVESAADLQRTLREYSLAGLADRIDCPTLVLAGADDHFVPVGLGREFAATIGEAATLEVFETETGAAEHCQVGNLSLATGVIYDWIDDVVGR
jgi:pimeloyl-ACP methyl ester carboxylesterase